MFAIVRINTFDPEKFDPQAPEVQAFNRLHASQPGYAGSLSVELGENRRLVVNLWQSERDATAALAALGSEVGRVLEPLMAAPSQLLGAGQVVETDLTRGP
jgi:hypothetical protein